MFCCRLRKRDVETPYAVHLSLLEGHVNPEDTRGKGSEEGQELAKTVVDRWYMAPGVRRIEVRQNGVVGSMFLPPGEHGTGPESGLNIQTYSLTK